MEKAKSPPKQVKILGVIYCFYGILWLAITIYSISKIPPPGSREAIATPFILRIALFFFLACFAFFLAAFGILKGERWGRNFALVLSTLMAVLGFLLFSIITYEFISGALYYSMDWLLIIVFFLTLAATSLLCIYYLTRPQVKTFLKVKHR